MSVLATEEMSAVETGQMSSVETGKMSAVETGLMSAVEARQKSKHVTCPNHWITFRQRRMLAAFPKCIKRSVLAQPA